VILGRSDSLKKEPFINFKRKFSKANELSAIKKSSLCICGVDLNVSK